MKSRNNKKKEILYVLLCLGFNNKRYEEVIRNMKRVSIRKDMNTTFRLL